MRAHFGRVDTAVSDVHSGRAALAARYPVLQAGAALTWSERRLPPSNRDSSWTTVLSF